MTGLLILHSQDAFRCLSGLWTQVTHKVTIIHPQTFDTLLKSLEGAGEP